MHYAYTPNAALLLGIQGLVPGTEAWVIERLEYTPAGAPFVALYRGYEKTAFTPDDRAAILSAGGAVLEGRDAFRAWLNALGSVEQFRGGLV